MRELVESEEGHSEVEKVEEVEEILELVETKQDNGFEAGGRVGDTQEYFEGDIGIKHKGRGQLKKNVFFRALPELPEPPLPPPPLITPIRATWSSFFGSRNLRFESQFRTKNTIYTI